MEKYAIYGVNRVAKDFLYMFEELDIVCFLEDSEEKEFVGKKVYPVVQVKNHMNSWDKIIVCDFDKDEKKAVLNGMGLKYGVDYVHEEDFFERLDKVKINPEKKKVVVWGTGKRAGTFRDWNTTYEIKCYIDTYKRQEEFYGIPVKRPNEITDWSELFVIIAVAQTAEIKKELQELGLIEYRDFCDAQEIMNIPSQLLRKTIFDKAGYDLTCDTMLNHAEILTGGGIFCCCTTYVDTAIGNINDRTFSEVWSDYAHKIFCLSVQNKTYSFCNKKMCPYFIGKKNTFKNSVEEKDYKKMEDAPGTVAIGFDATCNLRCATCRRDLFVAQGNEAAQMLDYAKIVNAEMLQNCKFLIMAGNGEVFASPAYKSIYTNELTREIPNIRLLTNGTLFTPQKWEEFRSGKEKSNLMLTVSIDAATSETYAKIRCGGNFDKLKENMNYASELRKKGELKYFRLNFVVQRENYLEMVPFVKWGMELGVDEIFFTKILNWGTYSEEEFKEVSMMEADGITPKPELQEILDMPEMQNPIVDLGTIRYSHASVEEREIDNYYMWELKRAVPGLFECR